MKWLTSLFFAFSGRAAAQQVVPIPAPPPFPIVEAPKDGIAVRVLDAEGKPAAGAFVTWFKETPDDARILAPEPGLSEYRRSLGKTVLTDRDGETRVGPGELVIATSGTSCAGSFRGRLRSAVVLRLKPARSIAVLAVDHDGKPRPDVPVALRTSELRRCPQQEWRTRTDASGVATIGPLELFADLDANALEELFVAVDAPMKAPLRKRFTLKELPREPLRLDLPPIGKLVIDVDDADGTPATGTGYTHVRKPYEFESALRGNSADGGSWPESEWVAYDALSHHELPCVETGLRFVVDANRETIDDVKQVVVGPKAAGETVSIRLRSAPPMRLSARVLDERGDPITAGSIEMYLSKDRHLRGRQTVGAARPDPQGRVSVALTREVWKSSVPAVPRWITIAVRDPASKRVVATSVVALEATKEFAARDLGDIRTHAAPRLSSGIVVDDAGTPIAGADVTVTIGMTKEESEGFDISFLSSGDALLRARSDADGTFEIDGDDPGAQLSIEARADGVERAVALEESREVWFTPGATDLRLVLARCGTIRGVVHGDPEEVDDLSYSVRGVRLDGSEHNVHSGLDAGGKFEWEVPAGIAEFEICREGSVIAKREKIEVKPGAVVEIEPIELASAAHQVELTIVDELGKPVSEGWVALPAEGEDERLAEMKKMFPPDFPGFLMMPLRRDIVDFKDGKATLRSEHEPRPFAVGALGRAAVVVMHPAAAERIELVPLPVVRLVVDFDGDPLPEDLTFFASLSVPNDAKDWFRFGPDDISARFNSKYPKLQWITLARGKLVELPIRALGPTALGLTLGRRVNGGFTGRTIAGDPASIDIARGKDQLFHVRVERAAIDSVIAEYAKQEKDRRKDKNDGGGGSEDDGDHR